MADPFVGEIRIVGFNFAPKSWAFCNGQILPISQNTALFSLLGTNYGGNGTSTFALPNLQGGTVMHPGSGPGLSQRFLGETGGSPTVTLLTSQLPNHTHTVQGAASGGLSAPANTETWGSALRGRPAAYATASSGSMSAAAIATAGASAAHNNMPPFLVLNFIISLVGVFPSR